MSKEREMFARLRFWTRCAPRNWFAFRILSPEFIAVPGFDFHALKGHKPRRYTVHVNGPWCITFGFETGDAWQVDFEQYH